MLTVGHKDILLCVGFYTVLCQLHDKNMMIYSHQLSCLLSLMLISFGYNTTTTFTIHFPPYTFSTIYGLGHCQLIDRNCA